MILSFPRVIHSGFHTSRVNIKIWIFDQCVTVFVHKLSVPKILSCSRWNPASPSYTDTAVSRVTWSRNRWWPYLKDTTYPHFWLHLKRITQWSFHHIIRHFHTLTHWGRVTHICVSKLFIIGSDNGLSPDRRQAIIWTNAGLLLIGTWGTNFSEILIQIHAFSFRIMHSKISSKNGAHFVSASMC